MNMESLASTYATAKLRLASRLQADYPTIANTLAMEADNFILTEASFKATKTTVKEIA